MARKKLLTWFRVQSEAQPCYRLLLPDGGMYDVENYGKRKNVPLWGVFYCAGGQAGWTAPAVGFESKEEAQEHVRTLIPAMVWLAVLDVNEDDGDKHNPRKHKDEPTDEVAKVTWTNSLVERVDISSEKHIYEIRYGTEQEGAYSVYMETRERTEWGPGYFLVLTSPSLDQARQYIVGMFTALGRLAYLGK